MHVMMNDNGSLSLSGMGSYLPPSASVPEAAASSGIDTRRYGGWGRYRTARELDHPSTMGAEALEKALADTSCGREELALVLYVGVSRDYPPSWSVATEIMRILGVPGSCLGLDLQAGCLSLLPALEIAGSWLRAYPGRHAAIVAAERWSHTVSRSDAGSMAVWGHSDGAGALVVTLSSAFPSLATFRGARYVSWSEDNDAILVKYGGTRFPSPPPGENPFLRCVNPRPFADPMKVLIDRYMRAVGLLKQDFEMDPAAVVCNQISPGFIRRLASACEMDPTAICVTGEENGHVGSVDTILGFQQLRDLGRLRGDILVAASTPYAVGAGAFSAP